ncbi:hypothetical protein JCM18897A_59840 [Streptomyces sp. JCM 18897]
MHAEFGDEPWEMCRDSGGLDDESLGDLLVRHPLCEERQDVVFVGGEDVRPVRPSRAAGGVAALTRR